MTLLIESKFLELSKLGKKAFIPYVTSCYPDFDSCLTLLERLSSEGVADVIEIGIPFSDPMGDGKIIQKASKYAIEKSGANIQKTFKLIKEFRKKDKITPIITMTYANPIYHFGVEDFFKDAKNVGIDGVLIVDLPIEEQGMIASAAKKNLIGIVNLITPNTPNDRILEIIKHSTGFIYFVSILGITGTKLPNLDIIAPNIDFIKQNTKLPVVLGFGINSKEQVDYIAQNLNLDGVVVGSSLINEINQALDNGNTNDSAVELYINKARSIID